MLEKIYNEMKEIHGGMVLDVATGAGEFIGFIKNFASYDKIIAIDLSQKMQEQFKIRFENESNIEFIQMDAEKPTFPKESFDTVCISNSLHHFNDVKNALNQVFKLLKPGGRLIINEMQCDNLTKAQKSHDILHRFFAKIDEKKGMVHKPTFTSKEIVECLDELNLTNVKQFDYEYILSDEQTENQVNRLISMLDNQIETLGNDNDSVELIEEINAIRTYLRENSYSPAKSIFIISQKV